jgi:signal transduction histidine kinase
MPFSKKGWVVGLEEQGLSIDLKKMTARQWAGFLLLTLLAAVAHANPLPLFLDYGLALGQAFIWILLLLFGWRLALSGALIAAVAALMFDWFFRPVSPHMVFAHIVFVGVSHRLALSFVEFFFVVAFEQWGSKKRSLVVLVAGFWAFIGMPLHVLSHGLSPLSGGVVPSSVHDFSLSLALFEFVGGLVCALIASALSGVVPFVRWIGFEGRSKHLRLGDYFFNTLALAVACPSLVLMMLSARMAREEIIRDGRHMIEVSSGELSDLVQVWFVRVLDEVRRFGRLGALPDALVELEGATQYFRKLFPEFRYVDVVDPNGQRLIGFGSSQGLHLQDRLSALRAVSADGEPRVIRAEGFKKNPLDTDLVLVVPVFDSDRTHVLQSVVFAELDVSVFGQVFDRSAQRLKVDAWLLGEDGAVVLGDDAAIAGLNHESIDPLRYQGDRGMYLVPFGATDKGLPAAIGSPRESIGLNPVGLNAFDSRFSMLLKTQELDVPVPWTIVTKVDTAQIIAASEQLYVQFIEILLALVFVSFGALKFASGRLSNSLDSLATLSSRLARDFTAKIELDQSHSSFREIQLLQANFLALSTALRMKFDELMTARAELELRVANRTQMLLESKQSLEREVDERKRLAKDRDRIIEILEASADFVAMVLPSGGVTWLNQFGHRILGLSIGSDVSGISIFDIHPDWAAERLVNVALPEARRVGFWIGESAILSFEGKTIPVSQMVVAHKDVAGEMRYFSTVMRDMRQFKMVQDELEQARFDAETANGYKTMFMANMSHEIRTPVAVIRGFSELLGQSAHLSEEEDRWLVAIQSSSRHLEILINDILDISKVERGIVQFEVMPTKLIDVLAEVKTIMEVVASAKGIELRWRIEGLVPPLFNTDAHRLKQILLNLIGNSIKFTESGWVELAISLEARAQDQQSSDRMSEAADKVHSRDGFMLLFIVSDTGIGIAADKVSRLFQPFAQADSSITRRFGGTGLGLYLSRRLAENLGGSLNLQQSVVNEGSTFVLSIDPGVVTEQDLVSGSELFCGISNLHQQTLRDQDKKKVSKLDFLSCLRVLVAEDSPDLRMLVGQILKSHGAECFFVRVEVNEKDGF